MNHIDLPSGCTIPDPSERLAAFCSAEYIYYDAIVSTEPNKIEPIDVLATVSVNSYVDRAAKVYGVHQGMRAACEPLLPAVPTDAGLLDLNLWRDVVRELLHASVQVRGVLLPVATKVLHRKRRHLIPMLDNVILEYYFGRDPELRPLLAASQDARKAADVGMQALDLFRADLVATSGTVESLGEELAAQGFALTAVRILEILLWTEVEPRGGYRSVPPD